MCRYPENNLFTLRKKTNTYENLKRPFVKSAFFLPLHLHFSCVSSCDFCVSPQVFFACIQKLSVSLEDIN